MIYSKFNWVPVNEGLPSQSGHYLVTYKGEYIQFPLVAYCYYSDRKFECENVTAWGNMPIAYDFANK